MASAISQSENQYLYLYSGKGAERYLVDQTKLRLEECIDPQFKVVEVDESHLKQDSWHKDKSVKGTVFPGGSAISMSMALGDLGLQNVRSSVVDKGKMHIGFCAGALLGADKFIYNGKDTSARDYDIKLLNFSNCPLTAPADVLGHYAAEWNEKTARVVKVAFGPNKETCHIFWNGGGAYTSEPLGHNGITLVEYKSVGNIKVPGIAAIRATPGIGVSVMSHVHPEVQLTLREIEELCPAMEEKQALADSVPGQKKLMKDICLLTNLTGTHIDEGKRVMEYYLGEAFNAPLG